MNALTIAFVAFGLALVVYGFVSHSGTIARALAIAVGVVIFLFGLAFDRDPRDDRGRWR